MKQHFARWLFILTFFSSVAGHAQAALITSHFEKVGGNNWRVDLSINNNDLAQGINEFTLYFSESQYSNLAVISNPAAWDSIVAQPDTALAAPGFFDTYNAQALALGETQSGFTLAFSFSGQQIPSSLPFDLIDDNFQVIASGTTAAARLDEPAAFMLLLMGMVLLVILRKSWRATPALV